jgi:DNA-binding FadR family transcriptional regulator
VLRDYQSLLDAIETGDAALAGEIAARHMSEALEIRLQMYASDPGIL